MAPALTSNSFRLAPGFSKPDPKPPRTASFAAQARQTPFSFAKRKEDALPEDESAKGEQGIKFPSKFFIDLGKIPDAKSLAPVVALPSTSFFASPRRKDPRAVFVAGASGQSGARIAWALLRQGFTVRAGVSDLAAAQELARVASTYKIISPEESKRLNAVESSFEDAESIAKAIGPATKVVVTIGAGEKGPTAEVTTEEALEVVRAAKLAGVGHVSVVYNAASGMFGGQSTYNVLDGITSFFSNLLTGSQPLTLVELLMKLAELDVSYTVIKASLTEDYAEESSYPMVVSNEGSPVEAPTEFKVSRSQIARLVAGVFSNTAVAENKVVEVSTSRSATPKPIEELFRSIPEDGRRKAYAEAAAKAKAEEEALLAVEKAREVKEAAKKPDEVPKLEKQKTRAAGLSQEAWLRAAEAGASLDNLLGKAKGFGSWDKLSAQLAAAVAQTSSATDDEEKKPNAAQIATVRGQAKARRLPRNKAVVKQSPQKPQVKPKQPDSEPEVKKIFGGLFKQETIYVDDD